MSTNPQPLLKIIVIRHGEKPPMGDNLSPQGLQRSLQLPAVLVGKVGVPDAIYVPTLATGPTTKHARMFQTITPLAVQYNLNINTQFDENQVAELATHLRQQTGTILVVWEHHRILLLGTSLRIEQVPPWQDTDFDRIWIITVDQQGEAHLAIEQQFIATG